MATITATIEVNDDLFVKNKALLQSTASALTGNADMLKSNNGLLMLIATKLGAI